MSELLVGAVDVGTEGCYATPFERLAEAQLDGEPNSHAAPISVPSEGSRPVSWLAPASFRMSPTGR